MIGLIISHVIWLSMGPASTKTFISRNKNVFGPSFHGSGNVSGNVICGLLFTFKKRFWFFWNVILTLYLRFLIKKFLKRLNNVSQKPETFFKRKK